MNSFERPNVPESAPKFDALVVLGAVMEWNQKRNSWEFPTIIDRYVGKLVMGKARAIAAQHIHEQAKSVLVTGGADTHPETGEPASRAEELAKLIAKNGLVPEEKIIPIGTTGAGSVGGNVENVVAYLRRIEHTKPKRVGILSPKFQIERAKLMFEAEPYFAEHDIELEWIAVEDVLQSRNPRYKQWVDAVYATPEAEINRTLEEKGIQDFKEGTYTSAYTPPEKP